MQCRSRTGKGSAASSRPDIVAEAMTLPNEVVEENYWRATNSFTDKNKAKIFIGMEPLKRVGWVMRVINIKDL